MQRRTIIIAPSYARANAHLHLLNVDPRDIVIVINIQSMRGWHGCNVLVVDREDLEVSMRDELHQLFPYNSVRYVSTFEPSLPPPHFETVEQADAWAAEVRASSEWTKG